MECSQVKVHAADKECKSCNVHQALHAQSACGHGGCKDCGYWDGATKQRHDWYGETQKRGKL